MPVKTGLLCVPTYDETAVEAVRGLLAQAVPGLVVLQEQAASMQRNVLEEMLCRWCDEEELDLVVTIGGTLPAPGPSSLEIVPAVTQAVAERLLPGLGEAMRAYAEDEIPLAIIDGSLAAIRGRTLLLNLPAGAVPAALFLEGVLDVIGTVVAHLQEDPTAPQLVSSSTGSGAEPEPPARSALDAEDFAAFLKRKRQGQE
jgi:molybdopterin biosynthesis enzyme MoaB